MIEMKISISEQRLREYVDKDKQYQTYKNMDTEPGVFERFHYVLCFDIENVLNMLENYKTAYENLLTANNMLRKELSGDKNE